MAHRRMFSKQIIDSDEFMDMPLSTQAVYMHLCMHGDDDGFVSKAKSILRMICGTQDDLDTLAEKGFIRIFENSVVAIVHWRIHNYIRSDRYKPTIYTQEKEIMMQESPKTQEENDDGGQLVYQGETQVRLGKVRSGKVNIHTHKEETVKVKERENNKREERVCECEKIILLYNDICKALPKVEALTDSRKNAVALLLRNYSKEQIEGVFVKANGCDFLTGKGINGWRASFDWLISEDNFLRVMEGAYDRSSYESYEDREDCSYDIDEYERFSIFGD